jgi:Fic family protein
MLTLPAAASDDDVPIQLGGSPADHRPGEQNMISIQAPEPYLRIEPLAPGFADPEALAVESLGDVWRDTLQDLRDSRALAAFNEQLYRRWAIETGILERLYSIDRGVTQMLVERGLDVSLIEHGSTDRPPEEVIAILRDHREAVQYVMDFVAGDNDLSLHFIRSLHQILTAHQHVVEAVDQFGLSIEVELIRGDWKQQPNNPTRPDGLLHAYCPPHLVQEEMEALLRFYAGMADGEVPTTIKSAWLHHRFTQIHPFQDGNGRVARALAAFVLVKRRFFPIVIDREDRSDYIACLETADRGDLQPLVTMWNRLQKRSIESALSLSESVLSDQPTAPTDLLRTKLLEAITDQARKRRAALQAKQKSVLTLGDRVFDDVVRKSMDELRAQIDQTLKGVDPNFYCGVDYSTQDSQHWFKIQLVEIASGYEYFCDMITYHRWSRLKIRHRDAGDDQTAEIIISMHSLGRTFSGVLALSGYFAERDLDSEGRRVSGPPHRIADRPASFTYAEEYHEVARRVKDWIDMALNIALEAFRRNL